jgi:DNA-binding GntR family transcriptional regulator
MSLTEIQTRAAYDIVAHIRRGNIEVGTHLAEIPLAQAIGTSRFPVRAALKYLETLGVVHNDSNRGGYCLNVPTSELTAVAEKFSTAAEDPVYLKIAEYRLSGRLPDTVSETNLMNMFSASRFVIRKAFSRIQQEGWAKRRSRYGWTFLPMIDSPEAYDECVVFRQSIEPAAILYPLFRPDLPVLEECRKQQEFISQRGYKFMTPVELFEAGAGFHETLMLCSGNRFALQTVRHLNQLRRLVEYRHAKQRQVRQQHAQDHVAIIDDILDGNRISAAARLHKHLECTRGKITPELFAKDLPEFEQSAVGSTEGATGTE